MNTVNTIDNDAFDAAALAPLLVFQSVAVTSIDPSKLPGLRLAHLRLYDGIRVFAYFMPDADGGLRPATLKLHMPNEKRHISDEELDRIELAVGLARAAAEELCRR